MLGMVVELPQLRLQGSTPLAALAQQLHLGHHAAQVVPVVPRQALDLVDVLAQVQNLGEIREEGDERLLGDGGGGVCWCPKVSHLGAQGVSGHGQVSEPGAEVADLVLVGDHPPLQGLLSHVGSFSSFSR